MPDWLMSAAAGDDASTPAALAVRLVIALVSGLCVTLIYRLSHGRETHDASTLGATLVLLAVLIAMVSIVIGSSVARAFSLVGALSIVRFRTVVEDTRDTAFVIFAVIVGMAAGSSLHAVSLIGIPIVGVVAIAMSRWPVGMPKNGKGKCTLVVRVGLGSDPSEAVERLIEQHLETYRAVATGTARQGAALDFTYAGRLRSSASHRALVAELNQTEGVQSVELRLS